MTIREGSEQSPIQKLKA